MPKVDEELSRRFHRAARPVETDGLLEGLERRRSHRERLRRIQAGVLAFAVLAVTAGGFLALSAIFEDIGRDAGESPALPGNGEIVFSRLGDDGRFHLYAAQPDGSSVRQITQDATNDTDPAVSPDGETIAYVHALDQGVRVLATVPIEGGAVTWLTEESLTDVSGPAWSPDGSTIAVAAVADDRHVIMLVDVPSGEPTPLVGGGSGGFAQPDWSPDGDWLVFSEGRQLWTVSVDGSDRRSLGWASGPGGSIVGAWSPDGAGIAVSFSGGSGEGHEIWTTTFDPDPDGLVTGGAPVVHVATAVDASLQPDLTWAPDGSALLVSDGDWIYRVDATLEGDDPRDNFVQLVRGRSPSWQPIAAGSEPIATATPEPDVSPSPEPVGQDVGFGFAVCQVTHVRAQFDGLGEKDTAYVATPRAEDGTCPSNVGATAYVGIDLDEDGLVDASYGPIECEVYYCRVFAAPDLDADVGRHELLVVEGGGSIAGLGMYALGVVDGPAGDEPGIVRIEVGEPDDPAGGFVTGEPVRVWVGGDEGWSYRLSCEDRASGRVLVAASAFREIDTDGPVVIHETTLAYGGLRMGVVDVVEREEPASYDPLGPQPDELCGTPIPLI